MLEGTDFSLNEYKSYEWDASSYNFGGTLFEITQNKEAKPLDIIVNLNKFLAKTPAYFEVAKKNLINPTLEHTALAIQQLTGTADMLQYGEIREFYLKEKASIENLSIDLDTNKIIVTAIIKKNTGLGFADLVNKSRVDYLVELLREGKHEEYTIEALAKMSGFGSRQTMYKAFAKFRNQSPTDFIDSLKH